MFFFFKKNKKGGKREREREGEFQVRDKKRKIQYNTIISKTHE